MDEIVTATDDDVARFYRGVQFTAPWVGKAIRRGKLVAGFGGVMEIGEGLWFAFLDIPAHLRRPSIYRHVLGVLDEAQAMGALKIRAVCDTGVPRAEAMLRRIGFEPTEETDGERTVFEWQRSEHS